LQHREIVFGQDGALARKSTPAHDAPTVVVDMKVENYDSESREFQEFDALDLAHGWITHPLGRRS
jgi:hypothetical protein